MDFVEQYIVARRSVRKYEDKQIEQEKIDKMVRACFYAPTAMNRDPRSLIIIDEREILTKLAEVHPYAKFAAEAPLAMVVCAHPEETRREFFIDDCAASTQNILIAARTMGIGSCWCGVYHTELPEKISTLLNVPENVVPYSLIVLGYPAQENEAPKRDIEARLHYNNW